MSSTSATAASTVGADEAGSAAQRDRRKRILESTISIARSGGFDAVQMRAVAESADVALGTLYRYFPSKIHLLVSALGRQFEANQAAPSRRHVPGATPAERVSNVLAAHTRSLQSEPKLTEALTRAFMFADSTVSEEIHFVGMLLTDMVVRAMHGEDYVEGELSEEDVAITRVISDVWLAALVAWVTGRSTAAEVTDHVNKAIALLLR